MFILLSQQTWEMVGLWEGYYLHLNEEEIAAKEGKNNFKIK